MKKLSIEEQCKRIKAIMSNSNMVTCPDCKQTYLPLTNVAEEICPLCGVEINDYSNFYEDDHETVNLDF